MQPSAPCGAVRHASTILFCATDQHRWLELQNVYSQSIEAVELAPGADIRAAYEARKAALAAEGWELEADVGFGFCFARRGRQRVQILIRATPPGLSDSGHGGYLGPVK